jgi:hypothetical protein
MTVVLKNFGKIPGLPYQAGLSILVGENGDWFRVCDARCRLWRRFLPLHPQKQPWLTPAFDGKV